jgi:cell division protein FtsL
LLVLKLLRNDVVFVFQDFAKEFAMKRVVQQHQAVHRIFVVVSIFLLAVMSVFYIWLKVKVGLLANEIEELRKDQVRLIQQNYRLRGNVVHLSSYERITGIAQNQLGLVFIQQEVILPKSNTR